jgi:hypothetical protein
MEIFDYRLREQHTQDWRNECNNDNEALAFSWKTTIKPLSAGFIRGLTLEKDKIK